MPTFKVLTFIECPLKFVRHKPLGLFLEQNEFSSNHIAYQNSYA